jgi:hypothetical protein
MMEALMRDVALMTFTLHAIRMLGGGTAHVVTRQGPDTGWYAGPQPLNGQALWDLIGDGWLTVERGQRAVRIDAWTKIITYTREDEPGTLLRAAGWKQEGKIRGRGWHSARRVRSNTNSWIDKVRWSKALRTKTVCRGPSKDPLIPKHLHVPFMENMTTSLAGL